MMTTAYRYSLFSKSGKDHCPSCGRKTFVPYQDTRTYELLPEEFGRCDREANCNYSLSPYDKGSNGLSYAEEIFENERQQWKQENGYTNQGHAKTTVIVSRRITDVSEPKPPVLQTLPQALLTRSLGGYNSNNFAYLLRSHFGIGTASELIDRFGLGTYKADYQLTYRIGDQFHTKSFGKGGCIFWVRDVEGRVYGGQSVLFDRSGKTVKHTFPDGEIDRCNRPISWQTKQYLKDNKKPLPEWLLQYEKTEDKFPFPFGLHQLPGTALDQPIAIVESPKTAMLAAGHFPQFTWMAIWSLSYLNKARLSALQKRKIVLFPDSSINGKAFSKWSERAQELNREGFQIKVNDYLEKHTTKGQKILGFDLADFILHDWRGYPPEWDTKPGATPTIRLVPNPNRFYYAEQTGISPDRVYSLAPICESHN